MTIDDSFRTFSPTDRIALMGALYLAAGDYARMAADIEAKGGGPSMRRALRQQSRRALELAQAAEQVAGDAPPPVPACRLEPIGFDPVD